MAEDIKKLADEARTRAAGKDYRTEWEEADFLVHLADTLEDSEGDRKAEAAAHAKTLELLGEVLAERDALRAAIQDALLPNKAWDLPPSVHESLSRALGTKEPDLDDMTKADIEQEERDHIFDAEEE